MENYKEILSCNKPLSSRQRKNFVEHLALRILKYCFKDTYNSLCILDKPDLQMIDKSLGIEVTEAVSKVEAQIDGEFGKYQFEVDSSVRERRRNIIELNGGKLDELGLLYPVKNGCIEKIIFQEALRNKFDKLTSYLNEGFTKMGLFIYYDEPPIPFKIKDLKDWFDEVISEYSVGYDELFFSYPCGLIHYIIPDGEIRIISIKREDYENLQYEVRKEIETK